MVPEPTAVVQAAFAAFLLPPPPLPQTHLSILAASSQVDLSHSYSVRCTRRTRSLRRVRGRGSPTDALLLILPSLLVLLLSRPSRFHSPSQTTTSFSAPLHFPVTRLLDPPLVLGLVARLSSPPFSTFIPSDLRPTRPPSSSRPPPLPPSPSSITPSLQDPAR